MTESWTRRAVTGGLIAAATPAVGHAAPARLPLRLAAGKLFVPVVINGVGAQAILDTGAARSSLDATFAKQIGIKASGFFFGEMIQGPVRGAYARDVVVRIGEALVRADGAVTLDYSQLSRELGRPVQVVLGRELFETFVVELDIAAGEAAVLPRAGYGPASGAQLVPLSRLRGRMTAPVILEDLPPLRATVDIGNDVALIVSPTAAVRRLLQGRRTSTALIGGEGSGAIAQLASARRLEVAGQAFADVPFQVAPRTLAADANLGLPVLQRFKLALDFGGRRMWLASGAGMAAPFVRDRTGLNGYLDGALLHILHVAAGGPAEKAGFKVGDRVIAIDGEMVATANANLSDAPVGRTLDFSLEGGGHRRLTLADYY